MYNNAYIMLKPKTVLALGVWLISVAFLGVGLPIFWQSALYMATGAVLIFRYLFFITRHRIYHGDSERQDTFVQNSDINRGNNS
jgi:hypothetical protein